MTKPIDQAVALGEEEGPLWHLGFHHGQHGQGRQLHRAWSPSGRRDYRRGYAHGAAWAKPRGDA